MQVNDDLQDIRAHVQQHRRLQRVVHAEPLDHAERSDLSRHERNDLRDQVQAHDRRLQLEVEPTERVGYHRTDGDVPRKRDEHDDRDILEAEVELADFEYAFEVLEVKEVVRQAESRLVELDLRLERPDEHGIDREEHDEYADQQRQILDSSNRGGSAQHLISPP